MSPILDKPIDYKRSPAQTARNLEAIEKLQAGTLQPGELFRLVTGAQQPGPGSGAARAGRPRSSRASCRDCKRPVKHAGTPYKSQPLRCRPCGKEKRQRHNRTYKEKVSE